MNLNPEFIRNVWLELTRRRLILMSSFVGASLAATTLIYGDFWSEEVVLVATNMFWIIIILMGSRDAARAVVGEIRERTWDQQRLSAIGPASMTWGKLFGATVFAWYGGAICLVVIVLHALRNPEEGTFYLLAASIIVGLSAQALALLSSLVAAQRRSSHTRLSVFLYQVLGVVGALTLTDLSMLSKASFHASRSMLWWGISVEAVNFGLVSSAAFLIWALVGCYRHMRLELQEQNRPYVWLGFLAFVVVYYAGLVGNGEPSGAVLLSDFQQRIFAGLLAVVTVAYAMALFDAKDPVLYRKILTSDKKQAALSRLPAWGYAYLVSITLGFVLAVTLMGSEPMSLPTSGMTSSPLPLFDSSTRALGGELSWAAVLAALGFLTRDCFLFVIYGLRRARGAAFAALITLALVYVVVPIIVRKLDVMTLAVFWPVPTQTVILGPIIAWAQAALMVWLAARSMARSAAKVR